jgi:hypothetical protein
MPSSTVICEVICEWGFLKERIQECSSEECLGDTLNAGLRLNTLNVFDTCIIIMQHHSEGFWLVRCVFFFPLF